MLTPALNFTLGDAESSPTSLTLTKASSNPALVPAGNIVFGGSGASRTVTVTPAANQSGTATLTITVSDGFASTLDSFALTVNPVNDPPTISTIPGRSTTANTATAPIPFTVGDIDTALSSLGLSGSSSNQGLVPDANIVFGGSGASRTVTVTPAPNQSGTTTITITVSDGSLSTSTSFGLSVVAQPSGLVAAYGFEEGTGSTVSDASGNGINGAIVGATWTSAGRYGNAVTLIWATRTHSKSREA